MLDRAELEHFLNQCRVKLVGASDSGIKLEFYDACKEFLKDTNSWIEHIHLPVIAGQHDYQLVTRRGGQIIRLLGVWDGNRLPVPATMQEFGKVHIRWTPNVTSTIAEPPVLGQANPYLVVVVKNVERPTTRDDIPIVPDYLLRVYSECLIDGVLGRMMTQTSKSYSNQVQGMYHLKRFRTAMVEARVAAATQNTVGAQNWSFPRNFRVNSQRGGMVTAWPPETF